MKIWRSDLSNISEEAVIGENCVIHAGVHIHDDVIIGDRCKIEAMVFLPNGVRISDDVFLGPGTVFTNDRNMNDHKGHFRPVETIVERQASIGANCTILAGVKIGEGAKVGMGSVVTKDVPPHCTVYGNPARVNKTRS